jgi:CO dehydrogenase maturation factor
MDGGTITIAVAGKGGSGKSTVAALTVQILAEMGFAPIFAVDADPAGSLGPALGLPVPRTVADLTAELRAAEAGGEAGKERVLAEGIEKLIVEGEQFDLLSMGRPAGRGCYCYINSTLAAILGRLGQRYRAVVVDNEAGMEHLARGNLARVDHLVLVAEPTPAALAVVERARAAVEEAGTVVVRAGLVLNRVAGGQIPPGLGLPDGVPLWAVLAEESAISRAWAAGSPLIGLTKTSQMGNTLAGMWSKLLV